jgi:hypothetical protein
VPAKCPNCHTDNPETVKFCGECGTQLIPPEGRQVSKTLTFETRAEGFRRGIIFAGRYEILAGGQIKEATMDFSERRIRKW